VTGFGILGHAENLCSNQLANVQFKLHTLPILKGMRAIGEQATFFRLLEGYSAETSGGLLIAMPHKQAVEFVREIEHIDGFPAWIVGDVIAGTEKKAFISEHVNVIEV